MMNENRVETKKPVSLLLKRKVPLSDIPDAAPIRFHSMVQLDDGHFICSDELNHRLLKFNRDGKCVDVIGSKGNGTGEFWYPRGLTLANRDGEKVLAICDSWNHRIQLLDLNGAFIDSFGSIGSGDDEFDEPVCVVKDLDGDLLVLDRCNHRIKHITIDGKVVAIYGEQEISTDEIIGLDPNIFLDNGNAKWPLELSYPAWLGRLENSCLVVADTNNQRVAILPSMGELVEGINLRSDSSLSFPTKAIPLSAEFCLIVEVSETCHALNIQKPWIKETLKDFEGVPIANCSIVSGKTDKDKPVLFLLNPSSQEISVYEVCIEQNYIATPDESALEISSNEPSDNWFSTSGEHWARYLQNRRENESSPGDLQRFVDKCLHEIKETYRSLLETEKNLLASLTELIELDDKKETGTSSELDIQRKLVIVELNRREEKRNKLRFGVAQNLSWVTNSVDNSEIATGGFLRFFQEMVIELDNEQNQIISTLKTDLEYIERFSLSRTMGSCVELLFIHEHESLIRKTFDHLNMELDPAQVEIPDSIKKLSGSKIMSYVHWANPIVSGLCEEFGYHQLSINLLKIALNRRPELQLPHPRKLIKLCMEKKDYSFAEKCIKQLMDIGEKAEGTFLLAQLRHEEKKYDEEIKLLDDLSALLESGNKEHGQIQLSQANMYSNLGLFKKSNDIFRKFRTDDSQLLPNLRHANNLLWMGEYSEAITMFEIVSERSGRAGEKSILENARLGIARSNVFLGRLDIAEKVIMHSPFEIMGQMEKQIYGGILRLQEDYEKSSQIYQKSIIGTAESIQIANLQTGINNALAGKEEMDLKYFSTDFDESQNILFLKGTLMRLMGKNDSAKTYFEQSLASRLPNAFVIALEFAISDLEIDIGKVEHISSWLLNIGKIVPDAGGIILSPKNDLNRMNETLASIASNINKNGIAFSYDKIYEIGIRCRFNITN